VTIESEPVLGEGRRFEELEGLRAWLSWSVVGWHIIQYTALNAHFRILGSAAGVAHAAVEIFMILSGFVITHLLLIKQEPYRQYITRRVFRLFPLYLVMATAGIFTTGLAAHAITELPWSGDPGFEYRDILLGTFASQQAWFPAHLLLHLTLMQGVVPDNVLPYSSATLIGPAWSLSLEWQFYLIAPLLVGALRRPKWAPVAVLIVLLGYWAAGAGLFGVYRLESSFPTAGIFFLTGIASRLGYTSVRALVPSPLAVAVVSLVAAAMLPTMLSIGLWIAFYAFLVTSDRAHKGIDRPLARLWERMFGSPAARWFGGRSYGVYLAHWPILQLTLFLVHGKLGPNLLLDAAILLSIVVPATLLVSEMLHRGVERPMIRLGGRVSAAMATPRAQAARVTA